MRSAVLVAIVVGLVGCDRQGGSGAAEEMKAGGVQGWNSPTSPKTPPVQSWNPPTSPKELPVQGVAGPTPPAPTAIPIPGGVTGWNSPTSPVPPK